MRAAYVTQIVTVMVVLIVRIATATAMAMAFPIARIAARTTLVANKSQLQNEGISPEGTFPSRGDRDLRGEHADDLADNRRYARQRTEAVEPFTQAHY